MPNRFTHFLFAFLLIGFLALLNVRAHRPGDIDTTVAQLRFIQDALSGSAAERMQKVFPEGYVFTWSLYGLASSQVAHALPSTDPRREHHLDEARRAVQQVRSSQARSTFNAQLEPPYGAFYAAWSLYLLAEYIRSAGNDAPKALVVSFETECERFAEAVNRSGTPFLPSYADASWPADTAVGIAALGIHDQVLEPRYAETIDFWVYRARLLLDYELDAISHAADPETGIAIGGVRGSSLALTSRVLIDADPEFAAEQYSVLRRYFVDYTWGVPGVREYPHGIFGRGDVDSGPILFGYSGPAVVVGAAAARVHGDESVARILLGAVEVGGIPVEMWGNRRYAGGLVTVGDAFIAWSRSSSPTRNLETANWSPIIPAWWAAPAHAVSAVLCALALSKALWARKAQAGRHRPAA